MCKHYFYELGHFKLTHSVCVSHQISPKMGAQMSQLIPLFLKYTFALSKCFPTDVDIEVFSFCKCLTF